MSHSKVAGPRAASSIIFWEIPMGDAANFEEEIALSIGADENFPTTVVSTSERRGSESQMMIVVPAKIAISLYDAIFGISFDRKSVASSSMSMATCLLSLTLLLLLDRPTNSLPSSFTTVESLLPCSASLSNFAKLR